jgi:hypothetical protein
MEVKEVKTNRAKTMNAKEAREQKYILEGEISGLITAFEIRSHLRLTAIDVVRVDATGYSDTSEIGKDVLAWVEATVEL